MSGALEKEALALLYSALGSPIGILLRTNNIRNARVRLNAAKRNSGDPALQVLGVRIAPAELQVEGQLVICRTKEAEE